MLVYHNDGDGLFTEISHRLGLDKPAKALGITVADYDRDGRIDLYIANDSTLEFLFHQMPDGKFEDAGLEPGVAANGEGQTYAGMGVDFADYDNDGWPDIAVTDLANQRCAVYHNSGDGTFDYASNVNGIGAITLLRSGWSLRFIDYDNDGWKDLLTAPGPRSGQHRKDLSLTSLPRAHDAGAQYRSQIHRSFPDLRRSLQGSLGRSRHGDW